MKAILLFLGIGFLFLGAILAFISVALLVKTRKLLQSMATGVGRIVSWSSKEETDIDNRTTVYHTPTVSFTAATGQVVEFVSRVAVSSPFPDVGGTVPIRYARNNPGDAVVDRVKFSYAGPIMLFLASAIVEGAGLVLLAIAAAG